MSLAWKPRSTGAGPEVSVSVWPPHVASFSNNVTSCPALRYRTESSIVRLSLIHTKGDPPDRHACLTGCEGCHRRDNICIAVPRSTSRTARSLNDACCSSASVRGLRTSATARPLTARICRSPPLRSFHAPSSPCPRVSSQAICNLRRQIGSKMGGLG